MLLTVAVAIASCGGSPASAPRLETVEASTAPDHDFVIPAGTGERLLAGEGVEVLPATLRARVGEVLRIVNQDEQGHLIGAFYVRAGETLVQRFTAAGTFEGECSVHPSGRFVLEVGR
jgi:plastocyanin